MVDELEELKETYLLNRENYIVMQEFFSSLALCLSKTLKNKKYTLSKYEADELVQSVLIEVNKRLEKVENVLAYSQKIMKIMFFKMVRKRPDHALISKEIEQQACEPNSFHNRCMEMAPDLEEKLKHAINSLPPPNNRIVQALFYDKATHKELAKELGVPINQIGMKKKRAIKRLQEIVRNNQVLYEELENIFGRED